MNVPSARSLTLECVGKGCAHRAAIFLALLVSISTAGHAADDWPMAAKDYASTRFSTLSEINAANVAQLKLAFTFSTGTLHGLQAAPIVAGNTMYVATPYPNYVYALDLTKPGANLKWKFEPKPDRAAQGVACCDTVNRGVAYSDGRVFLNTLDGQTIALDAQSGAQLWRTKLGDIKKGETMTMAPLVVKDKVIVGNSGSSFGVRGWLAALDAKTGKVVWRAYSTGPDSEVLIGADFKPFYSNDQGKDLGVKTWPPDGWKTGGGTAWGWISYDPALNLIFYGTSNPGPWNAEQRSGDNKWTAGIFARNPDTGQARWFYQYAPHDLYAYGGVNENVLLDLSINGAPRRVLIHPDRNGYAYVIDRATGEVVSARAYAEVTTITSIDLKSGRPQLNPDTQPRSGASVRQVCPSWTGAKDWQPSAWSPRTTLLYLPLQNLCQDTMLYPVSYIAGTPYLGAEITMYPGRGGHRGGFGAWDPVKAQMMWTIEEPFPVASGALATAGDVVFYGTLEGWFKAVDARTGQMLWRFKTGSGIVGQPVTYRGPDGKQYVAILSGVGGAAGAVVAGDIDVGDGGAANGFANAMRDLPAHTAKGGALYVFALP